MSIELEHAIGFAGCTPDLLRLLPDGTHYVYAFGGCVVLASLTDIQDQTFFRGHSDAITCLDVDPSGRYCASAQKGDDADVLVWDLYERTLVHRFEEHDYGVASVCFSTEGPFLVSAGDERDNELIVWNYSNGTIVARSSRPRGLIKALTWGGRVRDVKWRRTNEFVILCAGSAFQCWILDPQAGSLILDKDHVVERTREFTCVALSVDEERCYVGTTSGDMMVVDMHSRRVITTVPCCGGGVNVVFAGEDRAETTAGFYAGGGDGSLHYYSGDGIQFIETAIAELGGGAVTALSVHDFDTALCGTTAGVISRVNLIADRNAVFPVTHISNNHTQSVHCVSYQLPHRGSQSSGNFASCAQDGQVVVRSGNNFLVRAIGFHSATPLCLAYGSVLVFVGYDDGAIRAYDCEQGGEPLWTIPDAHTGNVKAITISHDEQFLMTGGEDGAVRQWNIRGRNMTAHLKAHSRAVEDIQIFPTDRHAISVGADRALIVWDLVNQRRISMQTVPQGSITGVALGLDQQTVVTCGMDSRITYWDLTKHDPISSFPLPGETPGTCIALSPDNKTIAVGCHDCTLRLFDFTTGRLFAEGIGHAGPITRVIYHENGSQIVTSSLDGAVCVWNVRYEISPLATQAATA